MSLVQNLKMTKKSRTRSAYERLENRLELTPAKVIEAFVVVGIAFAATYQVWSGDLSKLFVVAQAILFSAVPFLLKRKADIHTPASLRISIVLFMFSTLLLGEMHSFYERFWWWDLVFHGLSGLGFTLIGVILLALLFKKHDHPLKALLICVFAVSFALALASLWEVFEFCMDLLFHGNMQPSPADTMHDIMITLAGGLIGGYCGWRWLRYRHDGPIEAIIEEGVTENAIPGLSK